MDTVFAKSDDLYPDLTVFPRDLCELGQSRLERLHLLNSGIAPSHLVEWKFTNSFTSIQRGHLRTDAMKLELLSWYFHARGWRRPEAIQVIFRFPHERLKVTSDRIMAWYSAADLGSEIPSVTSLLIDDQGIVTTLHKPTA